MNIHSLIIYIFFALSYALVPSFPNILIHVTSTAHEHCPSSYYFLPIPIDFYRFLIILRFTKLVRYVNVEKYTGHVQYNS